MPAPSAPVTLVTLASSYHTSIKLCSNSTPLLSKLWTCSRLMPGVSATLAADQSPMLVVKLAAFVTFQGV